MIVGHAGGGSSDAPVYEVGKSLRYRASLTAYLTRTFGSTPTNRDKWTYSTWIKRGGIPSGAAQYIFSTGATVNGNDQAVIGFFSGQLAFIQTRPTEPVLVQGQKQSTAVFVDPSSDYHIVVSYDSANATVADRIILSVNGTRITSFAASVDPSLNLASLINAGSRLHTHGRYAGGGGSSYFDGYQSETHFVDGQVLAATDFGQTDPVTGVWVPKAYTGTYGNFGFYLPFSNGSSLSTLTADASGNGNDWTANNISLTAGVNYDWMEDTPTNNHCTLNPLAVGTGSITNGYLTSGTTQVSGTFDALAFNSYWEVTAGGSDVTAGVISASGTTTTTTVTANKTFGFRLSAAGALDYRNITDAGSWTSITTGLTGQQFPYGTGAAANWNFGQLIFSGTVPSGYAKLCSRNIPASTVVTSGSFIGNASSDGPVVFTNGVPISLSINGNVVTFGTHAYRTAGGFKVISTGTYNTAGTNTYSITSSGAAFKNARAQLNP